MKQRSRRNDFFRDVLDHRPERGLEFPPCLTRGAAVRSKSAARICPTFLGQQRAGGHRSISENRDRFFDSRPESKHQLPSRLDRGPASTNIRERIAHTSVGRAVRGAVMRLGALRRQDFPAKTALRGDLQDTPFRIVRLWKAAAGLPV
ncbi:MAG: hypothetical protein ACOCSK_03170 [Rhodothermales bacterium]